MARPARTRPIGPKRQSRMATFGESRFRVRGPGCGNQSVRGQQAIATGEFTPAFIWDEHDASHSSVRPSMSSELLISRSSKITWVVIEMGLHVGQFVKKCEPEIVDAVVTKRHGDWNVIPLRATAATRPREPRRWVNRLVARPPRGARRPTPYRRSR
jgi:hypothetical protein